MSPDERNMLADGAKEIEVELSEAELDSFDLFTKELLRWNSKLNLTSLKNISDIITKHYIDSLTIARLIPIGSTLLDIGSGGGFPSIPLKIARQDIDIVSVDSVMKKINFQRQVARLLHFSKFRGIHARVEDLYGEFERGFDVVVARAVSDIAAVARMALPFFSDSGKLIAMRGSRWKEELEQSNRDLDVLGLCVSETRELSLPVAGDKRGIVILERKKSISSMKSTKMACIKSG